MNVLLLVLPIVLPILGVSRTSSLSVETAAAEKYFYGMYRDRNFDFDVGLALLLLTRHPIRGLLISPVYWKFRCIWTAQAWFCRSCQYVVAICFAVCV